MVGERLDVYFNHPPIGKRMISNGKIRIVKTKYNQAIAYAENLRSDHLMPGDWIKLKTPHHFKTPKFHFVAHKQCPNVTTVDLH